jgi:ABC-type branched-subunit amino acid transport system permease subunit
MEPPHTPAECLVELAERADQVPPALSLVTGGVSGAAMGLLLVALVLEHTSDVISIATVVAAATFGAVSARLVCLKFPV